MRSTLLAAFVIAAGGVAGGTLATFHTQPAEAVASRPGTVETTDAQSHIGQSITVEGTVSEVHIAERATFIDMGGGYPNQQFMGVIFSEDRAAFPDMNLLEGKVIDITGTVQLYRGTPEIVLKSAHQIRSE